MRYEEYIKTVVAEYEKNSLIATEDFPDFDLYIDQLIAFFDKALSAFSEEDGGNVITKAMINNYSKKGLVPRPEKKKYSREHMLMIASVFFLKDLYQIDSVEMLMRPIVENHNSILSEKIDFEKIYEVVMELEKSRKKTLATEIENEVQQIKKGLSRHENYDDQIIEMTALIMDLSLKAEAQKYVAESLMKEYFIKPAQEKAERVKRTKRTESLHSPQSGKVSSRAKRTEKSEANSSAQGSPYTVRPEAERDHTGDTGEDVNEEHDNITHDENADIIQPDDVKSDPEE